MDDIVKIILDNSEGKEFPLSIRAENTPLGKKWVSQLKRILDQKYLMEKNFCFLGFPSGRRGFQEIVEQMNESLSCLFSYRRKGIWENGFPMQEENLRSDLSQGDLNRLHHYFELLMGQTWNLSGYYLEAEPGIRKCIRDLNFLIHEYEFLKKSFANLQNGKSAHALTIFSFLHGGITNIPIEKEDLPYFSLSSFFGSVKAHYAQTGKCHYDAWRDGDQEIHGKNISGLRVLSGEFIINWFESKEIPKEKQTEIFREFYAWLGEKGFKILDPSIIVSPEGNMEGIGFPLLGRADLSIFGTSDAKTIQKTLSEFSNIRRVEIGEHSYRFDYLPFGDEFNQMVKERL